MDIAIAGIVFNAIAGAVVGLAFAISNVIAATIGISLKEIFAVGLSRKLFTPLSERSAGILRKTANWELVLWPVIGSIVGVSLHWYTA